MNTLIDVGKNVTRMNAQEENYPKITVVTISYNAVNDIEKTILSVIGQSYSNIEYIIVDGGSKDGTVDIIRKYDEDISIWISEADKGRYDGMNKGIAMASGEWILFMNSGDCFHDNKVIEDIFGRDDICFDKVGVVWGDTDFYNGNEFVSKSTKIPFYKSFMPYRTGMGITHQSMFIKTCLAKQLMFDLKYKIAADFGMAYKIYKLGFKFKYIARIVSNYDINGISSDPQNGIATLHETLSIFRESNSKFSLSYLIYCLFIVCMRLKGKI